MILKHYTTDFFFLHENKEEKEGNDERGEN